MLRLVFYTKRTGIVYISSKDEDSAKQRAKTYFARYGYKKFRRLRALDTIVNNY